jgi:L-alanine-DL-glutamate epimerase-like enolase superfamily enzyme
VAAARARGRLTVAPHNPGGPVSTAASVQVCAGFTGGAIAVPDRPGFGVELDDTVVRARLM